MNTLAIKTPGVYINELDAFGNSVVPIATAVPAFIGYTPQAKYEGKSYINKPFKISSFNDFLTVFGFEADSGKKQYDPKYFVKKVDEAPEGVEHIAIGDSIYTIQPDAGTIYHLYNSLRIFYQNGGGDAYIVSVGGYGAPTGTEPDLSEGLINPNIKLEDLSKGLKTLISEQEPTMYVVPDSTLLSDEENHSLAQEMLGQSAEMGTIFSIFDIRGGDTPDPLKFEDDIETFREGIGNNDLKWGGAYYPFLETTITPLSGVDYNNLSGDPKAILTELILPEDKESTAFKKLSKVINQIGAAPPDDPKAPQPLSLNQINGALLASSPIYKQIVKSILERINLLPPSAAMAGVYTKVDNDQGVWIAPANLTPASVSGLSIYINDKQQENLNVDAVSGKSINAIRFFNGQGILVWGARTLDGNSQDWRYINVRRTMTFLEQSIKLAARAFVFAPNDSNTWTSVKSMLNNFLTDVWKAGALQGATTAEAFGVQVGLGTTMTAQDILNGFMNISVKVALVRPAEFIVITFQQQMPTS